MAKKAHKQFKFQGVSFKSQIFFGGSYCTKRAHRVQRPLSTKYPIHLVLKSSQAFGEKSFWNKQNAQLINQAVKKYTKKWGVKVLNGANVGNHLHFLIQIKHRYSFEKFIRGLTGEISLKIMRWNKNKNKMTDKFWDFRPYTRIVIGYKARLTMNDYISINQLEGLGCDRVQARMILAETG
jgi:REP element-mobilizing transposase RayT